MDPEPDAVKDRSAPVGDSKQVSDVVVWSQQGATHGPIVGNDAKFAALMADIERTRTQTGQIFKAIQDKLSPETLKNQAKEKIKELTMRKTRDVIDEAGRVATDVSSSIGHGLKENLAPVAIIGLGVTWLISSQIRKSSRNFEEEEYRWRDRIYEEESEEISEMASRGLAEQKEQMKGRMEEFTERAGDKLHDLRHKVGEAAESISHSVRQGTGQIKSRSRTLLYARPLCFAGSLLAIGAILGLILPRTQEEDRMMGGMRDSFMDSLFETGRETVSKVKHVADEARKAALKEAEEQDLIARKSEETA